MGSARKASAKTKKGGGRRPNLGRVTRANAVADLPTSRPVGTHAIDPSVGHHELVGVGQADTGAAFSALRLKAIRALEKLCDSDRTPPNVRASAARTLLELVGAIGARSKREEDQDLNSLALEPETMTLQDIDRELLRLGEG